MSITVFDVADWFLHKSSMTPKKLQKLVYYAYAWHYTLLGEVLFDARYEAWIHGPVCKPLWIKYKDFGWEDIPQLDKEKKFPARTEELLESVWNTYGGKSANELEGLTHMDEPYRRARVGLPDDVPCTNAITLEDIKSFYTTIYQRAQGE